MHNKINILLVIPFLSLPNELGNDRFMHILSMLDTDTYNIELLYSSFDHKTKKQRVPTTFNLPYSFVMLNEPGYQKNISLKRFYSHKRFSIEIKRYLKTCEKPDLIFCSVPSLDAGYETAKYAKKNKVPFFIDVQDIWPEAFKMICNIPIISDVIFKPMQWKANYIYKQADRIIAVSDTYRKRAMSVNKKDTKGLVVYLGTRLKEVDEKLQKMEYLEKKEDEFWLGYIGTLGSSYDIETVIKAIAILKGKIEKITLKIVGSGPNEDKLKVFATSLNVEVDFYGYKPYYEAMGILRQCDIAINPLIKNASQSIINKVGDYAASGLPVINSLQSYEYQSLLEEYKAGINIPCEDPEAMAQAILYLYEHREGRLLYGNGNRKLALEMFDRDFGYRKIIDLIMEYKRNVER